MHRRNRNIILFFEENENVRSITSKMVRLYMNRFIIDEEQRFEITGVFNLAKVPKLTVERGDTYHDRRRRLLNLARRNWIDDRELIKDAFKTLEFLTLFKTDVFIFMGTTLYLDTYYIWTTYNNNVTTLNELMQNLVHKCSSTTSISMTLLSGENHELHTKNDVQELYLERTIIYPREFFNLFGQSFLYDFYRSQSLNDDLENLFSHMISTNYFHSLIITCWLKPQLKQEVRNLFLYEMQSEDDIKRFKTRPDLIRRSDDHQYLLSLCKAITIHLK